MGKQTICICENKDADQLRGNCEADQRLCFRYSDSTFSLLLKSEISSFKPASVTVQAGLCQTCSETTLLIFPRGGSCFVFLQGVQLIQMKVAPPAEKSGNESPIMSFILLERYNAIKLVQTVHGSLANLSKVIRGTQLLNKDVQNLAAALLNQEVSKYWHCQSRLL